jgi:hypothetical protein
MSERLLWLAPPWESVEIKEAHPALGAALRTLRRQMEVDIPRWPSVRGGFPAAPTWEAWVERTREALTPGCHVFASSPSVAIALLTLSRDSVGARSFIADHLALPDAT